MTEFEKQFQQVKELLSFEDYNKVIKRIIDFTLDTENIEFYEKTNSFLNWLDLNETNEVEKKEKLTLLLNELYVFLTAKSCNEHQNIISLKGLIKQYASFSLGPIDLEIKTGEIIGLVGENGNGKTTLLRALCGELHPTTGNIAYNFERPKT